MRRLAFGSLPLELRMRPRSACHRGLVIWGEAPAPGYFMTLHKLQTDRDRQLEAATLGVNLNFDVYEVANNLVRARAAQLCDLDLRRLPIYRHVRFSVCRKVKDLFDDFAI